MKIKFIRFNTKDKLILHGLLYEPDAITQKVVLHIHGMAGNFYENSFLDSMAKTFTDNDWAFMTINTRGHDYIADFPTTESKYKRIGNAYEVFEECVYDIRATLDTLETGGFTEIALQGHSLGAPKVAYYIATTQDSRISKLILLSSADMVGLAEADPNYQKLMLLAQTMVKEGKGREILPDRIFAEDGWEGYLLSAQTYIDLSKRDQPVDIINTYDRSKPSALSEIRVPILAIFGSEDNAVIMPVDEALMVIKEKAKQCPSFDTAIIAKAPHSYAKHEDKLAETIIEWLK